MFKKKFTLITVLLALVCSLCMAFTACTNDDKPDDTTDPKDNATYTGLFTYVRDADGTLYYGSLVLFEDGSFWYENDMLGNDYLGTYTYNSDKTQITLTGENLPDVNGTYDVEVNNDVVTIKGIMVLALSATEVYYENFTYDAVRTPPQKKPLSIKKFYKSDDADSYFEVQTEGKYYLIVEEPEILSSGTYTKTEANGKTTYTLTDTLNGQNATYTFEYTYADEAYSGMLLKGTGIDAAGIEFSDTDPSAEREVLMAYTGTATSEAFGQSNDETVTLKYYSQTEVEIEFTIMGNANVVAGTAEVAYPNINFTFDSENLAASCIESCVGTIGADQSVTIAVTIGTANIPGFTYNTTLTEVPKERPVLQAYTGTATSEAFGAQYTEEVTLKYYSETEVEIVFTIMNGNDYGSTNVVAGTATVAYPNINFTFDSENLAASCIESCVGTIGEDFSVTIAVTISTANISGFTYTLTLTAVTA